MRKIYTGQDGVLRRKANFASLVNAVCYSGRRTIKVEELSLVEEELLDSAALRTIFPRYADCVTMHSAKGDIKLIVLSPQG